MPQIVIAGRAYEVPQFDELTMGEWRVFKQNGVADVPALGDRIFADPDALVSLVEIVKTRAGEKYDPAVIQNLRLGDLEFRDDDAKTEADAEASGGNPPTPPAAVVVDSSGS